MGMGLISEGFIRNCYYCMKPFIPRWLQIQLRRKDILRKRLIYSDVWPINEKSSELAQRWCGWPENKYFALVLTHEEEGRKGVDKCIKLGEIEEQLGFRSYFYPRDQAIYDPR